MMFSFNKFSVLPSSASHTRIEAVTVGKLDEGRREDGIPSNDVMDMKIN